MTKNITINAHSSIRISGERILYIDPFQLENAPHDADVVFVTHSHFDHFSPTDIEKIAGEETVFVMPEAMEQDAKNAGFTNLILMKPGDRMAVSGIVVEGIPSYNINKPMHPRENGWLGYLLTVDGTRIYVGGDMDATPEGAEVQCDVAMIPVGGTYTMNVSEGAYLVNRMKPKIAIPTHYGSITGSTEDGAAFMALVDDGIAVELKL